MTEEELSEVLANYEARFGGRARTHCDVCWTWADHAECTVPRLVAEVRRQRQEIDRLDRALAMCEDENESYHATVQRLTEANAAFHQAVNRQKAEIAEWTNAARKVFKGPQDADDYEDFDRRREAMEKEGLAALEDLMLGNGWANVESESTLAHMKRQLDSVVSERDRLKKQLDNILAMTGMVAHAAEPECTAARCGCVSLSPEEAVAEVLVRNGIKPLGVKR